MGGCISVVVDREPVRVEPQRWDDRRTALEGIHPCHHPGNRPSSVPSVGSTKLGRCCLQDLKRIPKKSHAC